MAARNPDGEIVALLGKLKERIPPNTVLTAATCLGVLKKKLGDAFPNLDWDTKTVLVESTLARLQPPPAAPAKKATAINDDDDDSDDDSDDETFEEGDESSDEEDEDDDASSGSDGSEEGEEASDSEGSGSDEEDREGSSADSPASEANEGAGDAKAAKRRRLEAAEAASPGTEAAPVTSTAAPTPDAVVYTSEEERAAAIAKFLRKVSISVRKQGDGETAAQYIEAALLPACAENEVNPNDLSKAAAKRQEARRELKALMAEADMSLAKESRRGRAQFGASSGVVPGAQAAKRPAFLDDD